MAGDGDTRLTETTGETAAEAVDAWSARVREAKRLVESTRGEASEAAAETDATLGREASRAASE